MQVDALQASMPNLTPSFLPAAAQRDILRLAELEGHAGEQALLEVFAYVYNILLLLLPDARSFSFASEPLS